MKGASFTAHSPFEVLSQSEIEAIHSGTLRVLAKTGVVVENDQALRQLVSAGARVDGDVVRFPKQMVRELLPQVPCQVTLHARNADRSVHLGRSKVHFTNGYGTVFVADSGDGQVRRAGLKDLRDSIILSDYLDNVHYLICQFFVQDFPEALGDLLQAREMVCNSGKHQGLTVSHAKTLDYALEIGDLAGSEVPDDQRPIYSFGVTSHSLLKYTHEGVERLMKLTAKKVPVRIVCGAIAGATSPVTLAGTLVVQNAEVLAGILMAQVFNPGAPVIYGSFSGPMDMATGKQLWGVPEFAILNAATAQLCRFYGIPFGYGSRGSADSCESDLQAGVEKTLTLALTAAAQVDVIHDGVSGLLGTSMITSLPQMVIDNEIADMIFRAIRGIEVNEETLALDVVDRVGPGGNYLAEPHTMKFMRQELWMSRLLDRRSLENRQNKPDGCLIAKAENRVKEILGSHQPSRLSQDVERQINRVIERAAKKAGVSLTQEMLNG